jgi:hypothetical protein
MAADTKAFWKSKNLPDLGAWAPLPTFLTKELPMIGHGIPAQFWKFTVIAWRHWLAPVQVAGGSWQPSFEFIFTKEQMRDEYNIHNDASDYCAGAYSVSGFCQRTKGRRHNWKHGPGIPTTLTYSPNTSIDSWRAFVSALKVMARTDKEKHWKSDGGDSFCVQLAWEIETIREQLKLKYDDRMEPFFAKMRKSGVLRPADEEHETEYVMRNPANRMRNEFQNDNKVLPPY